MEQLLDPNAGPSSALAAALAAVAALLVAAFSGAARQRRGRETTKQRAPVPVRVTRGGGRRPR